MKKNAMQRAIEKQAAELKEAPPSKHGDAFQQYFESWEANIKGKPKPRAAKPTAEKAKQDRSGAE